MINVDFSEKKPFPFRDVESVNIYPCIGKSINSDLTVVFFKPGIGMIIKTDNDYPRLYEFRTDWLSNTFTYLETGATASIYIANNNY